MSLDSAIDPAASFARFPAIFVLRKELVHFDLIRSRREHAPASEPEFSGHRICH